MKKFRFYVPIAKCRDLQALCVFVCVIVAMCRYFTGDIDRASFWMIAAMFNYLCHTNTWYWDTSIDIVHKKGIGIICVKLDDDYPSTAFICDLSVFELNRKQGIGRELMQSALAVARKHGKSYAELYVDKEKDWLVAWYPSLGFEIVKIDAHEYTMLKHLDDDKDEIKQYLAKEMAKS